MDVFHSPESGTPSAPLRSKSSAPRSGFVQQDARANSRLARRLDIRCFFIGAHGSALSLAAKNDPPRRDSSRSGSLRKADRTSPERVEDLRLGLDWRASRHPEKR